MYQPCFLTSRICALALGFVLPLMSLEVAHAGEPDDAQTYLTSIKSLFESLEYERALDQIQLARRMQRSTEEEVTLSLYEGIILAEQGEPEQCTGAFKAALLLRPEAKLPVMVSPKVEQHFESLRRKVKTELESRLAKSQGEFQQAEVAFQPQAHLSDSLVPSSGSSLEESPGMPEPSASLSSTPLKEIPKTGQGGLRSYSPMTAVVGSILVAAGGASWAMSRRELNRLRKDAPELVVLEDVQNSVSLGRNLQTVGIGLLGTGAACLVASAGMYALGGPSEPMALGVSTDGTSAFVYGRWP